METKPIRINSNVHKKLKVYAAKAGVSVIDVVDQAVCVFMTENTPAEVRESIPKLKTSKK